MNEEKSLTKKERREIKRQEKYAGLERRKKLYVYRRILIWVGAAFVIFGSVAGFFWILSNSSAEREAVLVGAVTDMDHVKGNSDSDVTIIEYSDFQCPACAAYYPIIKKLAEDFGDSALFVYRHFPLKQIHPRAEIAAKASEAAGIQDKFWEMHNILFENQDAWASKSNPEEIFVGYAETLGLDIEKFKNDINSNAVKERVDADYSSAIGAGINATPTFVFNGDKIRTPRSYEEFRSLIEGAAGQDR